MPYARIDDGFHDHPKVQDASLAAVGLWTLILSFTRRHLTDGRISALQLTRLTADRGRLRALTRLLACGLVVRSGDGYVLHDYGQWNDSKKDILEARRIDRERKRLSRQGNVHTGLQSEPTMESDKCPLANPTQPNPTEQTSTRAGGNQKAPSKKALRPIPDNWSPAKPQIDLAASLGLRVSSEADDFRDWTLALGRKYADWDRAFASHLRRQSKRAGPSVAITDDCRPPWSAVGRLRPEKDS